MNYDIRLLCYKRNGSFSRCWLAATNPKQFRKNVKRDEVEDIVIETLCKDIQATINERGKNANKRISLYLASQLVFGAVCIYEQQVQFLYENTTNAFTAQSICTFYEIKRKLDQDGRLSPIKNKKRRKSQVFNDLHLSQESMLSLVALQESLSFSTVKNEEMVTLREAAYMEDTVEIKNEFGPLTDKDREEFLFHDEKNKSIIDIFNDIERNGITQNILPGSLSTMEGMQESIQIPCLLPDDEVISQGYNDFVSGNNNGSPETYNRPTRTSTPLGSNMNNLETCTNTDQISMDVDEELCGSEIYITNLVPVQQSPKDPENDTSNGLSQTTLLPIVEEPKIVRRKQIRKKRLIIDEITKISSEDFYRQFEYYGDTQRCVKPCDDIVLPYNFYQAMDKQKYKMLLHCLKNGGLRFKQISLKLQNNFQRGCKTAQTEINDFSYIRNQDRKRAMHTDPIVLDVSNEVVNEELDGVIRATTDIEKAVEQNCFVILKDLNRPASEISHANTSVEWFSPEFQRMQPVIFDKNANEFIDQIFSVDYRTSITSSDSLECGKEAIFKKLYDIWEQGMPQINMDSLCPRGTVSRKYAARVFYSLLALHAPPFQLIKLIQEPNSLNIHHIVKSEKFKDIEKKWK